MNNTRTWAALVCVCVAVGANAAIKYQTSYNFEIDGGFEITNIILAEEHSSGGSLTWAFSAGGFGLQNITNPFLSDYANERTLMLGIAKDLPNDAPGQKHVVLFMDPYAAELSDDIAWGTLFRNTLEEQLIAAIELATSGQDWPIIMPGLEEVNAFAQGDAKTGILGPLNPITNPRSAWFATPGPLEIMAFSNGQRIGSGEGVVTEVEVVPEPASLAVLGLGAAALLRRRRR